MTFLDQPTVVEPVAPAPAERPPTRAGRFRPAVGIIAAVVVVVVVGAVMFVLGKQDETRRPEFTSLSATPDPSLKGTIAYLDGGQKPCVRVLSASGAWRNGAADWCGPGRTLRWAADGRLEHLEFSNDTATKGRPPSERAGGTPVGGRSLDVGTGATTAVSPAEMPAAPPAAVDPMLGPGGRRAIVTSKNGHVTLAVSSPQGRRTLLTADGGRLYDLHVLGWSPTGKWLLATDGRLLLITLDNTKTRILADDYLASAGEELPAITSADVAPITK